jgi:Icc-related predicted phosphoesterase
MKILCISDDRDPLIYSSQVTQRYADVDVVISAGDLPLKYYEFIVSSLNKPLYFVFGNHQTQYLHRYIRRSSLEEARYDHVQMGWGIGGQCIDGKMVRDNNSGLLLGGLGGSMRYNRGDHQFTEFDMFLRMMKLLPHLLYNRLRYKRFVDVLVTHAPPRGIGDGEDRCHTGFRVFLWFIRWFKPRYVLHGHMHLIDANAQRITRIGETEVINVYRSYLLEKE